MWIAIIIMGLLMIGYFVGQWLSKEYVQCVEAGPVIDVTADDLRCKSFYAPRVDLQKDGRFHAQYDSYSSEWRLHEAETHR